MSTLRGLYQIVGGAVFALWTKEKHPMLLSDGRQVPEAKRLDVWRADANYQKHIVSVIGSQAVCVCGRIGRVNVNSLVKQARGSITTYQPLCDGFYHKRTKKNKIAKAFYFGVWPVKFQPSRRWAICRQGGYFFVVKDFRMCYDNSRNCVYLSLVVGRVVRHRRFYYDLTTFGGHDLPWFALFYKILKNR